MRSRRTKLIGTIEQPRGTIKTTVEKVKVGNKIMVITSYDTEDSITIYIGSNNIYCIDAQIMKKNNGVPMEDGMLNKIRWDKECSLSYPFEKGSDTVMILQLLLSYIKDKYPQVDNMYFTDLSTRQCDDGSSVSLAAMKLFTDGRTWYEERFNAVIANEFKKFYIDMMNDANSKKKEIEWEIFLEYVRFNNVVTSEFTRNIYESTNTWEDFFKTIRDKVGISNFCIWLSTRNWFDIFILNRLKFHIMSMKFILFPKLFNLSYTILNTSGGKRNKYTLKIKNKR